MLILIIEDLFLMRDILYNYIEVKNSNIYLLILSDDQANQELITMKIFKYL